MTTQIVEVLESSLYNGMPADKAAALLGVDAEIAEKLYRESKS